MSTTETTDRLSLVRAAAQRISQDIEDECQFMAPCDDREDHCACWRRARLALDIPWAECIPEFDE